MYIHVCVCVCTVIYMHRSAHDPLCAAKMREDLGGQLEERMILQIFCTDDQHDQYPSRSENHGKTKGKLQENYIYENGGLMGFKSV